MTLPFSSRHVVSQDAIYSPYLVRLKDFYDEMDRKYEEAACRYGFVCRGCDDNCCRTRFYHHTFLEYFYLREGFRVLPKEKKKEIRNRAHAACDQMAREIDGSMQMCPLNFDKRCILYSHRPMICRLHGIPHELRKPALGIQYHQGCEAFHNQHNSKPYFKFDRTPLYLKLSQLEKDLLAAMDINYRIKMTVAEMLIICGTQNTTYEKLL